MAAAMVDALSHLTQASNINQTRRRSTCSSPIMQLLSGGQEEPQDSMEKSSKLASKLEGGLRRKSCVIFAADAEQSNISAGLTGTTMNGVRFLPLRQNSSAFLLLPSGDNVELPRPERIRVQVGGGRRGSIVTMSPSPFKLHGVGAPVQSATMLGLGPLGLWQRSAESFSGGGGVAAAGAGSAGQANAGYPSGMAPHVESAQGGVPIARSESPLMPELKRRNSRQSLSTPSARPQLQRTGGRRDLARGRTSRRLSVVGALRRHSHLSSHAESDSDDDADGGGGGKLHDWKVVEACARLSARLERVKVERISWELFYEWKVLAKASKMARGTVSFVSNCRFCPSELLRLQQEGKRVNQLLQEGSLCRFCKARLVVRGKQEIMDEDDAIDIVRKKEVMNTKSAVERMTEREIKEHLRMIELWKKRKHLEAAKKDAKSRLQDCLYKVSEFNRQIEDHPFEQERRRAAKERLAMEEKLHRHVRNIKGPHMDMSGCSPDDTNLLHEEMQEHGDAIDGRGRSCALPTIPRKQSERARTESPTRSSGPRPPRQFQDTHLEGTGNAGRKFIPLVKHPTHLAKSSGASASHGASISQHSLQVADHRPGTRSIGASLQKKSRESSQDSRESFRLPRGGTSQNSQEEYEDHGGNTSELVNQISDASDDTFKRMKDEDCKQHPSHAMESVMEKVVQSSARRNKVGMLKSDNYSHNKDGAARYAQSKAKESSNSAVANQLRRAVYSNQKVKIRVPPLCGSESKEENAPTESNENMSFNLEHDEPVETREIKDSHIHHPALMNAPESAISKCSGKVSSTYKTQNQYNQSKESEECEAMQGLQKALGNSVSDHSRISPSRVGSQGSEQSANIEIDMDGNAIIGEGTAEQTAGLHACEETDVHSKSAGFDLIEAKHLDSLNFPQGRLQESSLRFQPPSETGGARLTATEMHKIPDNKLLHQAPCSNQHSEIVASFVVGTELSTEDTRKLEQPIRQLDSCEDSNSADVHVTTYHGEDGAGSIDDTGLGSWASAQETPRTTLEIVDGNQEATYPPGLIPSSDCRLSASSRTAAAASCQPEKHVLSLIGESGNVDCVDTTKQSFASRSKTNAHPDASRLGTFASDEGYLIPKTGQDARATQSSAVESISVAATRGIRDFSVVGSHLFSDRSFGAHSNSTSHKMAGLDQLKSQPTTRDRTTSPPVSRESAHISKQQHVKDDGTYPATDDGTWPTCVDSGSAAGPAATKEHRIRNLPPTHDGAAASSSQSSACGAEIAAATRVAPHSLVGARPRAVPRPRHEHANNGHAQPIWDHEHIDEVHHDDVLRVGVCGTSIAEGATGRRVEDHDASKELSRRPLLSHDGSQDQVEEASATHPGRVSGKFTDATDHRLRNAPPPTEGHPDCFVAACSTDGAEPPAAARVGPRAAVGGPASGAYPRPRREHTSSGHAQPTVQHVLDQEHIREIRDALRSGLCGASIAEAAAGRRSEDSANELSRRLLVKPGASQDQLDKSFFRRVPTASQESEIGARRRRRLPHSKCTSIAT